MFSKKHSNIKFHVNPSSGSRVFPCGRTDGHRETVTQTHLTKLTDTFRNFSNTPKNRSSDPEVVIGDSLIDT